MEPLVRFARFLAAEPLLSCSGPRSAFCTANPDVLEFFAWNPFPGAPPLRVRAVIYRYWFTDMETKRTTGLWWRRELLGDYAPTLEREPDGKIVVLDIPTVQQLPQ